MEAARARYNERLRSLLSSRPDQLFEGEISYEDADLVPLDLLPNHDFERTLCTPQQPDQHRERQEVVPVALADVVERRQCEAGLCFIVGPPGAGKSTLMRQLALRLAERGEEVPVLVTADMLGRALASAPPVSREASLAVLVRAIDASLRQGAETARDLRAVGAEGEAALTLLVDGLDEVADRQAILQGIADMEALGDAPPFRRVLIASRPGAFEALPDRRGFRAVLRVLPLDQARSELLVRRLLGQWGGVSGELVERAVEVGGSVFQGSPLLLYLLCGLAKAGGRVPRDVVALYDGILDFLLRRGGARPVGRGEAPDQERTLQLCRLMAYVLHALGQSQQELVVDQAAVRAVLTEVVERAGGGRWAGELFPGSRTTASLLGDVLEGFSGLLCQQGRQGYVLLHRTLQEYLAASFLVLDGSSRPRWAPVRDFVVGGVQAGAARLPGFSFGEERLICSDWWVEVYRFAGLQRGPRWLGERMLLGEPSFREWLAGIRRHGLDRRDVGYRRLRHVVRACCRWDESGGEEELEEVGRGRVRRCEAEAHRAVGETLVAMLGGNRPGAAALLLLERVPRSEWQTCAAFSAALTPVGVELLEVHSMSSTICTDFLELLLHGNRQRQRQLRTRIGSVILTGLFPSIDALVKLLEHAEAGVRYSVVKALGRLGGEAVSSHLGAMEALVKLLEDAEAGVRRSAADVLGELGGAAVSSHPGAMEALVKRLEDPKAGVRWSAAEALGEVGEAAASGQAGAVEALVKRLTDEDVDVRVRVAAVLGRLDGAAVSSHVAAVETLNELLEPPGVRMSAEAALEQLGGAALSSHAGAVTAEVLVKRLEDPDVYVRQSAVRVLAQLGQPLASSHGLVDALLELLEHADSGVKWSAAEALGLLGGAVVSSHAGAMEALVELLEHEEAAVRVFAAITLGRLGGAAVSSHAGAVGALIKLLESKDADNRARAGAARALAQLGNTVLPRPAGVVEALVKQLESEDLSLKQIATQELGLLGGAALSSHPAGVRGIVKLLEHAEKGARRDAADALGRLGGAIVASHAGAMQALIMLLENANAGVRRSASTTLGRLGAAAVSSHGGAVDALVKRLEDAEPRVRVSAAEALGQLDGAMASSHAGAVEALVKLLGDAEPHVRRSAMQALGQLGGAAVSAHAGAVEALAALLEDADTSIRSSAAEALGKLGGAVLSGHVNAVAAMVRLLGDAEPHVRRSNAAALRQLGAAALTSNPSAMEALIKLLQHADQGVRESAAYVLGELGGAAVTSHAVEALIQQLEDPSAGIRRGAAEALGRLGGAGVAANAGVVEALLPRVYDLDDGVGRSAVEALGQLGAAAVSGHARAIETLIEELENPDTDLEWSVQRAFERLLSSPSCLRMDTTALSVPSSPPTMLPAEIPPLHAIKDFVAVGPLPGSLQGQCHVSMELVKRRDGAGPLLVRKRPAYYDMYDKEVTRLEAIEGGGLGDGERALFCRLVSWHAAAGEYVLVLEYCEGGDLEALLRQGPTEAELPTATVLRWAESLARAMDVMHRRLGRLHLDLKPANLLLTKAKPDTAAAEVKVADLGISQVSSVDPEGEWEGSVADVEYPMREFGFSAPEQGTERGVSPATDRYQLGLVLLQLTCRRTLQGMAGLSTLLQERQDLTDEIETLGLAHVEFKKLPAALQARWKHVGPEEAAAEMDSLPSKGQPLRQLVLDLLRAEPTQRPGDREILRRIKAAA